MTKCIICEQRPSRKGGYCANCASKIEAANRRRNDNKPAYFLTYQGHVVGLFRNGKETLIAKLLMRSAEHLPKRNTIDLNHYCEGYSREQIKRFKACVLHLAHA